MQDDPRNSTSGVICLLYPWTSAYLASLSKSPMISWQCQALLKVENSHPSLEMFKARTDRAWSTLMCLSLPKAQGLDLDDLKGPIQPRPFCDCVIQGKCPAWTEWNVCHYLSYTSAKDFTQPGLQPISTQIILPYAPCWTLQDFNMMVTSKLPIRPWTGLILELCLTVI